MSLADIDYLPTITDPAKILCVGLNYRAHQETGRGGEGYPTIFVRFADAQMGHNAPMVRPLESTSLDFEGEIALIIGKAGRRIKPADAMSRLSQGFPYITTAACATTSVKPVNLRRAKISPTRVVSALG